MNKYILFVVLFAVFVCGCKFVLRDASAHVGEITAEPVK